MTCFVFLYDGLCNDEGVAVLPAKGVLGAVLAEEVLVVFYAEGVLVAVLDDKVPDYEKVAALPAERVLVAVLAYWVHVAVLDDKVPHDGNVAALPIKGFCCSSLLVGFLLQSSMMRYLMLKNLLYSLLKGFLS